jgi:outer membrane biosynthesis protein TonB
MDVCELVGAVSATAPASPAAALRCIVEQGTQLLWAPAASSAARDGSAATNRDEGAPTAAAVPSHSSATASVERQRARKREQKRRARQRKRRQQEQERQRQQKMEGEQEPEQEEGEEGEEEEEVVAEAAAEHQRPSAVEDDEARAEAAAAVVAMVLGEPCPRAALGLAPAPAPLHRGAIEAAYRRLARRPLRPFWRALAEIYLCNVILSRNVETQRPRPGAAGAPGQEPAPERRASIPGAGASPRGGTAPGRLGSRRRWLRGGAAPPCNRRRRRRRTGCLAAAVPFAPA